MTSSSHPQQLLARKSTLVVKPAELRVAIAWHGFSCRVNLPQLAACPPHQPTARCHPSAPTVHSRTAPTVYESGIHDTTDGALDKSQVPGCMGSGVCGTSGALICKVRDSELRRPGLDACSAACRADTECRTRFAVNIFSQARREVVPRPCTHYLEGQGFVRPMHQLSLDPCALRLTERPEQPPSATAGTGTFDSDRPKRLPQILPRQPTDSVGRFAGLR